MNPTYHTTTRISVMRCLFILFTGGLGLLVTSPRVTTSKPR